jgi:hypothetical protein
VCVSVAVEVEDYVCGEGGGREYEWLRNLRCGFNMCVVIFFKLFFEAKCLMLSRKLFQFGRGVL